VLVSRKLETGAGIVAGLAASQTGSAAAALADHGTLKASDMEPAWSMAEAY
jgi:hypothetical protein